MPISDLSIGLGVILPNNKGGKIIDFDEEIVTAQIDGTTFRKKYNAIEILQINGFSDDVQPEPEAEQIDNEDGNEIDILSESTTEKILSLQAVEALRFGLVPTHELERLTLGYSEIKKWIISRFPEELGGKSASQINGPFGTGKSHTMALIRDIAQNEGYLVAKVEVDGNQVTLHNPSSLISQLWQSLRGNDLPTNNPLVELYKKIFKTATPEFRKYPRTKKNYEMIRHLGNENHLDHFEEELDTFLSGDTTHTASDLKKHIRTEYLKITHRKLAKHLDIKPVIGWLVADRSKDFINSLVSNTLIAKKAGYKGVIITIDEFEVESWWNWSDQVEERKQALINAISQFLVSPGNSVPLCFFFATAGQDDHEGDELINQIVTSSTGDATWNLEPWSDTQTRELAGKILALYSSAYELDEDFDEDLFDQAKENLFGANNNIRAFIKFYVGLLDQKFGPTR